MIRVTHTDFFGIEHVAFINIKKIKMVQALLDDDGVTKIGTTIYLDSDKVNVKEPLTEILEKIDDHGELIKNVIYQLQQLEPLLEIPDKGYVRNGFNAVLRTLKEGL